MARLARYRAPLTAAVIIVIVALGLAALHRLTETVSLHAARTALRAIPPVNIALALAMTGLSYFALTFYDVLALRLIGHPLPWRTAALASFTSYALSHNLGFSALTGGSARYRVYHGAGIETGDIARIIVIAGTIFSLGVMAVGGMAMMFHLGPLTLGGATLSQTGVRLAGCFMLALVVALPVASGLGLRRIGFRQWSVPVPEPGQAIAQIGVSTLDLAAAGGALFVLLPGAEAGMLPTFMLAYSLALLLSLVTHVPGGIGVFEATIIAMVPGDRAELLASLFAYRAIYYLLPLALAALVFAVREGAVLRSGAVPLIAGAQAAATGLAPLLLSAVTFVGGVLLLLSGALPSLHGRLSHLRATVPLPFVEASHVAVSLVGMALLVLAPGLYRRLDRSWHAVRALLVAGAGFALVKGLDVEVSVVLLGIAGLLQWMRPAFYRHTALTSVPLSASWLGGIVMAFGLSIWLGLFAYRQVDFQSSLWWEFTWSGNASRFLRAMAAAGGVLIAAVIWRLAAPAGGRREAGGTTP